MLPIESQRPGPSLVLAKDFVKAYAMLNYQRIYITPAEEKWLTAYGEPKLPEVFRTLGSEPLAETFTVAGEPVGVVAFPIPADPFGKPEPGAIAAVLAKARELRPTVKLLVGISSWGINNEHDFLIASEPVFDILLGAGPGRGLDGETVGNAAVFHSRTWSKGKYMTEVDIFRWPDSNQEKRWTLNADVRGKSIELGGDWVENSAVKQLFLGAKKDPTAN